MFQLENNTPFPGRLDLFRNDEGLDTIYVAVKGTFSMDDPLTPLEDQLPFVMADEYAGEEGLSSLKAATDLQLKKRATDIILSGDACAPGEEPVEQLDVSLWVGKRAKTVRVFGDRVWCRGMFGLKPSSPEPFTRMPLVYERAYGGSYVAQTRKGEETVFEKKNPGGTGVYDRKRKRDMCGIPLPNIENPDALIQSPKANPAPVGFGSIAPNWSPRAEAGGTYDDAWQQERAPYLPDDFDASFFNVANPDWIYEGYVAGGEAIEMQNLSPNGPIQFELPVCEMVIAVKVDEAWVKPSFDIETLQLEPNERRFSMVWRAEVVVDKKVALVQKATVDLARIYSKHLESHEVR